MPFITEELWQHLAERKSGESIMIDPQNIAQPQGEDAQILATFEQIKGIVQGVRAVRNAKNIAKKESLELEVIGENPVKSDNGIIEKMANISSITEVTEKNTNASVFMVGTHTFAVILGNLIDIEAERAKAEAELTHLKQFLAGIEKKLGNEKFVANAPEAVVALERKKKSDAEAKIQSLQARLADLAKG